MTRKYKPRTKEMFKTSEQISNTLEKFSSIDDKRKLITESSGQLWYIFGYKLVQTPWLTYQERYDIL